MRRTLKTAWPYLWRYRRRLALGLSALLMKDLFGVAVPLMIRSAVDSVTAGFAMAAVAKFAGLLLALTLAKAFFLFCMRVILIGVSRDIEFDLRNDLFAALTGLSSDFYSRHRTGDVMARATNDLNAVRMMLGPGIMYWTETTLTFLLAVSVMLAMDWKLTLMAIAPAPAVSFVVMVFGRKIHDRFERIQAMFSDISSRVQENLSSVRVIRAYVQEEAELRRFADLNQQYIGQNIKLVRLSGLFMPTLEMLIGFAFLIVIFAGGMRVISGSISLGGFVAFNSYMGMLVWPMIALGWVVNLMQRGTASLGRINQILHERPSIASPENPVKLTSFRGEIEFRNVTVRFPTGTALDGIGLSIPAGSTVAIVGHTGCGKTTLVNLVPRLLDPTEGLVLVDGVDLRELSPEDLRRRIGFVPQETFLFSTTIAENIAFGVANAREDEIRWAGDLAGLSTDIAGFPDGYQTEVGERGVTLSGGQKQRVAIARAILRNPRILILDDALSSVDTLTEERILRGLTEVMANRTVLLISHRVSTVQHADRIIVLSKGQIIEQGTHADLLAAGGYYAELYQRQLLEEQLEAI